MSIFYSVFGQVPFLKVFHLSFFLSGIDVSTFLSVFRKLMEANFRLRTPCLDLREQLIPEKKIVKFSFTVVI